MSEKPVDPYLPPAQLEDLAAYDQEVIDLLLLHRRKQEVVKILRQGGVSHKTAKAIVEKHTPRAQSLIDRRGVGWRLMGVLLFMISTCCVAAMAHYGKLWITLTIILLGSSYGSLVCFRKREVII